MTSTSKTRRSPWSDRSRALAKQELVPDAAPGMIRSTPQKIIATGTDWRFLNELKKELKG